MTDSIISETSKITNSKWGTKFKCYQNTNISDSIFGDSVSIGDNTTIERCKLGNNIAINRRSYINDSIIDDYSYSGINAIINFTKIGKFCSIARNVDIGGFDHDYTKATTMPMFRFKQLITGEKPYPEQKQLCNIGNDVWIAAGSHILHKANIGDGAIIGAGAIVTKDIPPYAIAIGIPARVVRYRFSPEIINKLLLIKWWDWPIEVIKSNIDLLINEDINDDTIKKLIKIKNKL